VNPSAKSSENPAPCQPSKYTSTVSLTQLLLAENVPEEKHAGSFQIQKLLHLVEPQETSEGRAYSGSLKDPMKLRMQSSFIAVSSTSAATNPSATNPSKC
jgi:hypothetical protein